MSGIEAIIENLVRQVLQERDYEAAQGMKVLVDLPEVRVMQATNDQAHHQLSQSPFEIGDDRNIKQISASRGLGLAYIIVKSDGSRFIVNENGMRFYLSGNSSAVGPDAVLGLAAFLVDQYDGIGISKKLDNTFGIFDSKTVEKAYIYMISSTSLGNSLAYLEEAILDSDNCSESVCSKIVDQLVQKRHIGYNTIIGVLRKAPKELGRMMPFIENNFSSSGGDAVRRIENASIIHRIAMNQNLPMAVLAGLAANPFINSRTLPLILDRIHTHPTVTGASVDALKNVLKNPAIKKLGRDVIQTYARKMKSSLYRNEIEKYLHSM